MKSPRWKVMLARTGEIDRHYAQTQRRPGMPEPGQILVVRDIDGTKVVATVRSFQYEMPTRSRLGRYTIDAREIDDRAGD